MAATAGAARHRGVEGRINAPVRSLRILGAAVVVGIDKFVIVPTSAERHPRGQEVNVDNDGWPGEVKPNRSASGRLDPSWCDLKKNEQLIAVEGDAAPFVKLHPFAERAGRDADIQGMNLHQL